MNPTSQYPEELKGFKMKFLFREKPRGLGIFFNVTDEAARNVLELYGSRGSILCEGTVSQNPGGKMVRYFIPSEKGYDALQERSKIEGEEIRVKPVDLFRAEVEDFVEAVKRRKPMNSAEESLKNQYIIEAAYKSQREERIIKL